MSLLIRSVTNTSATVPLPLMIPGFDPKNPVVVAPSATLDILSVTSSDTLHAMQGQLTALVADGHVTVAESIESVMLFGTSIPSVSVDFLPSQMDAGQVWYNTTSGLLKLFNGTSILTLSSTIVNPPLNSASTFAVLGDTAVTNTGNTVLTGDLGIYPGTSITGFPPGTYSGFLHNADATALQAHNDATSAAVAFQAMGPGTDLSSTDLGGHTAVPGVYSTTAAATWSAGNLTLNGAGTYVFLIGTSLTMPASANVVLTGGALAKNVYFVTGTTFTFGANDTVNGTILAGTSITFAASSVLNGRAICYGSAGTTVTFPSAGTVTVPS